MANCLLAWPDHAQPSTYQTPVLSGGSWEAVLPLANLQDRALATLARSTDALNASTIVEADLQIGRDIRLITITRHNISQTGLVRFTGSASADFSGPVYQSDWLSVWPVFYPAGSLPWGYPGVWSGVLAAEETDGYTMQFVHVLPAVSWARYWRVETDDESNPDGYVEIARVSFWSAWQPAKNMTYGAVLGWETDTPSDKALSGPKYYDRRDPGRVVQFTLDRMTLDTAMAKPFEMIRKLGIDGELFFVFDPDDDQKNMFKRSFLSTMRELSPIEIVGYRNNKKVFALEEVL